MTILSELLTNLAIEAVYKILNRALNAAKENNTQKESTK
jgi:hypothetical protein